MFTRIPRRGSHLRTGTRHAAHLRRFVAALAAITCAVLASASAVPAASAADLVRDPPTGTPPVPAPAAQVTTSGMTGWQIALIALGAALVAAIAAVIVDRTLATRRSASSTTA